MKIPIAICIILQSASCVPYLQDLPILRCDAPAEAKQVFSKAEDLNKAIEELTLQGVPGCAIAVYSDEGWWSAATGFAKIEDRTPMQTCHLQYLQSVSKTYMAVAILKLYEQGKISLDEPISRYLPDAQSRSFIGADKITIRMLLNHTSGIPEYNMAPAYVSYLLQHPDHIFAPTDYLKYIAGKPLDFAPGSKYSYRNTNYLVLALITDAITGDHAKFIAETIFTPLGLDHTFYRGQSGYVNYPELVNTYWDRHSDGVIENASQLQRNNVASLVGDDGIVTTPEEAVKFLKGLMEGKLISPATLDLMKTWVNDRKGNPTYGLGLDYATFLGHPAYGHSGGGIGAGCQLYYFPEKNIYVFTAINLGTVTDSPLHEAAGKTVDKIYGTLLK
jgi:D-alanyl-D-alanine carboxypeptidase